MDRRRFLLTSLAGTLAAPLAAEAQQAGKVTDRVSLGSAARETPSPPSAFAQGLRELGYVEGRNIVIEYRFADGKVERLPGLAAELVRLKVDVIVTAVRPPFAAASSDDARSRSSWFPSAIPSGLDSSRASRGRAATSPGVPRERRSLAGKRLELLREVVPRLARMAVLWNPARPGPGRWSDRRRRPALAVELGVGRGRGGPASSTGVRAVQRRARPRSSCCRLRSFTAPAPAIVDFAAKNRLPAISMIREFVGGGRSHGLRRRTMPRSPARRRATSTRSSRARSPPICRSSSRPSSSWSSTSRPPRRSASRSRRRCWRGRIR